MPNFWKIVNSVIARSDILIIVLDARLIDDTRNIELEEKIENSGKGLIFVLNKSDLVDKKDLERVKDKFKNCVFMSAKERLGTNVLRKEIMKVGKGEKVTVGVLGYPNTGKSSVINSLSGGGKAKVSSMSGHTKGLQLLKSSIKIYMIDTPGVIPFLEKDEVKHLLIGSMNPNKAKDPDIAAEKIIELNRNKVCEAYSISVTGDSGVDSSVDDGADGGADVHNSSYDDAYDILMKIAEKLNLKKKGGEADLRRVSVKVIDDWQKGKII